MDLYRTLSDSETSRHILRFYHPKERNAGISVEVSTVSSGLALLSELRWYIMRYMQEVLIEDGYANMYTVMKALVASGTDAVISIDHAADAIEGYGGLIGSFAYPTGYMKGLLSAAENEVYG